MNLILPNGQPAAPPMLIFRVLFKLKPDEDSPETPLIESICACVEYKSFDDGEVVITLQQINGMHRSFNLSKVELIQVFPALAYKKG